MRKKRLAVMFAVCGAASALLVRHAMAPPRATVPLENQTAVKQYNPVPAVYRNKPLHPVMFNSYQDFVVLMPKHKPQVFNNFSGAFQLVQQSAGAVLIHNTHVIYTHGEKIPPAVSSLSVPLIAQMPQLPRGCEVTSLAMLLQFEGIPAEDADKLQLAKAVKKDPTPYSVQDGVVHFGNPNVGFVGDMYSFSKPGYGVYHKPIADLAKTYFPHQTLDLSGSNFEAVKWAISQGHPVLVITNATFSPLPNKDFTTWETPEGPIRITMQEHAVVITGYNQQYVYFNDPLADVKNRKMPVSSFVSAWKQMGNQAVTILQPNTQ